MKKKIAVMVAVMMSVGLMACGSSDGQAAGTAAADTVQSSEAETQEPETVTEETETEETGSVAEETESAEEETESAAEEAGASATLVVYFSWSGNTENVALEIQRQTGSDLFEIEPAEPYTTDYNEVLDVAQAEQADDARPEIAGTIENMEDYDVIYLGFPNWWADAPMIIYTFLDDYDLSGKTIAPFVTSGGSGFSNSLSTIQSMEPDAVLTEGLSLGSSAASDPADEVTDWLAEIGLAE